MQTSAPSHGSIAIPSDCDLCTHARYFYLDGVREDELMDVCLKLHSFAHNYEIVGASDDIPAICPYYKRGNHAIRLISTSEALSALPEARRTKLSILILKERMLWTNSPAKTATMPGSTE